MPHAWYREDAQELMRGAARTSINFVIPGQSVIDGEDGVGDAMRHDQLSTVRPESRKIRRSR